VQGVPEQPQCGFSNMACRILDAYGEQTSLNLSEVCLMSLFSQHADNAFHALMRHAQNLDWRPQMQPVTSQCSVRVSSVSKDALMMDSDSLLTISRGEVREQECAGRRRHQGGHQGVLKVAYNPTGTALSTSPFPGLVSMSRLDSVGVFSHDALIVARFARIGTSGASVRSPICDSSKFASRSPKGRVLCKL